MKPQNVLITTDKPNPDWKNIKVWEFQAKIADFGLSRINESYSGGSISMTAIGGTPGYWAPEMFEAFMNWEGRFRSHFSLDTFAVGVIAYQLITGKIESGK